MNKMIRGMMIAVLSCVAFVAVASSASAITVAPAGAITGTAGTTSLSVNGIVLTCTSSTIAGSLLAAGTGTASTVAFNSCTNSTLGSFTVTALTPWTITLVLTSGQVTTTFSNVGAQIRSAFGCTFLVSGSVDIVTRGALPLRVSSLSPTTSNLRVASASGCLGIVNVGNAATFNGTYTLSAAQTVSG